MTNREAAAHVRSLTTEEPAVFPVRRKVCVGVFGEMHRSWINPPRRCQKLFNKAFRMPDGSKLVIVRKEEE
jgi:hypothetical protein